MKNEARRLNTLDCNKRPDRIFSQLGHGSVYWNCQMEPLDHYCEGDLEGVGLAIEMRDHAAAENTIESRPTGLFLPDRESGSIVGASRPGNEVT